MRKMFKGIGKASGPGQCKIQFGCPVLPEVGRSFFLFGTAEYPTFGPCFSARTWEQVIAAKRLSRFSAS